MSRKMHFFCGKVHFLFSGRFVGGCCLGFSGRGKAAITAPKVPHPRPWATYPLLTAKTSMPWEGLRVNNWGAFRCALKSSTKIQQTHTALWACVGLSRNKVE